MKKIRETYTLTIHRPVNATVNEMKIYILTALRCYNAHLDNRDPLSNSNLEPFVRRKQPAKK